MAIGGVALAMRLSPLFVSACLECALVSDKATLGEEPAKEYVGHYCPRGQDLILHILLHSPELASSSPRYRNLIKRNPLVVCTFPWIKSSGMVPRRIEGYTRFLFWTVAGYTPFLFRIAAGYTRIGISDC